MYCDGDRLAYLSSELNFKVTDGVKFDEEIEREYGTCLMVVGVEKNNVPPGDELPPESTVENWVTDSRCSRFMMPSADYMVNHPESSVIVRVADDCVMSSEGIGNLPTSFWSGDDWVKVILLNVAHVPLLGDNLFLDAGRARPQIRLQKKGNNRAPKKRENSFCPFGP